MRKTQHKTTGTCSRSITVTMDDQTVTEIEFHGGCSGNLQAICSLAKGRRAKELVALLEGIQCQNGTSCPDQLAQALKKVLKKK